MWYKYSLHILLRVIFPLLLGGMLYLLFGAKGIRLVDWMTNISMFENLRDNVANMQIPDWVIFNLPDGIWLFSLLQLIDIIWAEEKGSHFWIGLSVVLAMGHEIGQGLGFFSGTYDELDIISYAIVALSSILLNRYLRK